MQKRKTLTEYLAIACIFSVFLDKALRGVLPFDFYYYYPLFIAFLIAVFVKYGKIAMPPTWFMAGSAAIVLSGVFITIYKNILGFELVKQVFGIYFTAVTYYNIFFVFQQDLNRIFRYYLFFAFLVALHGIIDNGLHYLGIHLTTVNITGSGLYREYGIMGEPFFLTLALTPAVVYYLCHFKKAWRKRRIRFLTIVTSYFLTLSSIAVLGFVLGVFMSLYLNNYFSARRGKALLAPFLVFPVILLVTFMVNNVDLINARFNDTSSLFLSSEIKSKEAGASNSSTFALYSNYAIARDSFLENPLFGSGLGSHPIIFEHTFLKYFPSNYLLMYGYQNQQDANSKFLRLMSETGLVGLLLFFIAFFKFRIRKKDVNSLSAHNLAAINYSVWVYITLCLIRNGNYFNIGFFFFFFMYYLCWKASKSTSIKPSAKLQPNAVE